VVTARLEAAPFQISYLSMPNFIKLTTQSELPAANEAKEFPCGDRTICIANVNGEISAMDNVCLHRGGPLGQGMILKGKVVCPWHGWEWDPKTGEAGPPGAKIAVYPVKIEDGDVAIEM
jgi:nitrite reductase (NADH) small subunit